MAQQETYGNWLGPERLRRQPGIYSVASKMSPVGDFRPASPDSFEDDYDDVSTPGSDRGPPGKVTEMRAELEQLKSDLSEIRDLVQQNQTRLQFGIHQHQQELKEVSDLLCRLLGRSRRCGAGWRLHGNSCYSFSLRSLPWAGARNACADLGAELVVVGSEEEQEFLLEHSERGVSYWLGLSKGEQEGTWRWVSGESSDFRYWDIWRQDPHRQLKNCSTIGGEGRWVNEHCWERHRWICEKPGNC